MKFPAMNKRPRQAVVIPDLQGGLNLRDSVSMINDNQLTDCKNMWFRDGVLKTRPAIASTKFYEMPQDFYDEHTNAHDIYTEKQFVDDNGNVKNETCRLFSQYMLNKDEINFYWVGETYFEHLCSLANEDGQYFVAQKDYLLYCYKADGVYKYDFSEAVPSWVKVSEEEMYVPIIVTNGSCVGTKSNSEETLRGDMLEGFNLLGGTYKAICSTVDKLLIGSAIKADEEADIERPAHAMEYSLPYVAFAKERIPYEFTVKLTRKGRCETHTATLYNGDSPRNSTVFTEDVAPYGDLKMVVECASNGIIHFHFEDKNGNCELVSEADYKLNNMEIIAPYKNTDKNYQKVLNMSHCTWFGGDSAGINGGTRLFLGGNSEEPNLVVWSDLNNPLYFPENNYFYVGESSSAVTAFGKQSDMLVIFKNNETYYTQYNRNTNISADNLIDQSVIDYVGSSVYFPLTLIHSAIGCDCPDTVQLCRNRLVWASSDGKIYTLVTNNQYSERNIYEIGEMIGRKLKEDKELKKAHSTDWNGYYLLQSGSRVYVLDYNSYGYQYISSYSKTEDANLRIPWYYWEFELTQGKPVPSIIAAVDGGLKIINNSNYGIFVGEIAEDGSTDNMLIADPPTTAEFRENEVPINCFLQTKLFEFGAQGYLKNVDKVVLSLGNNDGAPILAEFVTDEGCEEEYITLDGEDTKAYSAGYIKSVPMRPSIRAVERFGVKLSCDGPLAVDGITLFYRVLGGAK